MITNVTLDGAKTMFAQQNLRWMNLATLQVLIHPARMVEYADNMENETTNVAKLSLQLLVLRLELLIGVLNLKMEKVVSMIINV